MAQSGYYYLTTQEIETLKNATKTTKSSSLRNLVDNILDTLDKQSSNDNSKYYTAAETKYKKLNNDFPEALIIENNAPISFWIKETSNRRDIAICNRGS